MTHIEILKSQLRRFKWLPERYLQAIREIEMIQPGLESDNMRAALELLPGLCAGGMAVLAGPIGCGKTFAACVLGALTSCYVPDCKFVQARAVLKASFENQDYAKHRGLLIVDDLGREHFTDKGFGIAEWDYFFDSRYSAMQPTIVTTNLTEEEFVEKYNRRIFDRLKECAKWLVFSGSSLRKREEERI